MSASGSPSSAASRAAARALQGVRVTGGVRLVVADDAGTLRVERVEERGGYRIRFPHRDGGPLEAIVLNTGGGIVGGDRVRFEVTLSAGPVVVTSQAAERAYRSLGPDAEVDVAITLGAGARLDWLPQETIAFSGARLKRRFDVDMAADAHLIMAEMLVFGRKASGETLGDGLLHDAWSIRRDGRPVFAEAMRLDGGIAALLARDAIGAGARASALIVVVAPGAEDWREPVRNALAQASCDCGVSAWNGMLTARFLGTSATQVRAGVIAAVTALRGRHMPRVWTL